MNKNFSRLLDRYNEEIGPIAARFEGLTDEEIQEILEEELKEEKTGRASAEK